MESKLSEDVRLKLAHWSAMKNFDFLFEAFSIKGFPELTEFGEQNKFNLRKSIMKLNIAMKQTVPHDRFEDLLFAFDEFEKWCGVTDSFNGQEYYFQLVRRYLTAVIQVYVGVLSRHLGCQTSNLKLLSPTKHFCSSVVHARNYVNEITELFERREENESLLDEQLSFQEIRDLDRISDFKIFVHDILIRDEDGDPLSNQYLIDPSKALRLLHCYSLDNVLQKLTSLIEQFESQELSQLSIKFTVVESPNYRSVRHNLFPREDEGYDSAQDRVYKSFADSPKRKRRIKIVSPETLKPPKDTPLGLRPDHKRSRNDPPKVRQKWTADELKYLLIGVERHGLGNHANIIDDKELHPHLKNRNNVQIKDKVRNLLNSGTITIMNEVLNENEVL